VNFLETAGFRADDPRLVKHFELLRGCEHLDERKVQAILGNSLIRKSLRGDLAVKNFPKFVDTFQELYHAAKPNQAGQVATYIPQLANQAPNLWGVSVCSVDGQRFSIGDSSVPFCVQSTSKPITYCLALEINGEEKVHQHVGREPSGRNFNDRCLMQRGAGKKSIPHNPYINAGAIMTSSLVKMDGSEWDRFTYMMSVWQKLSGGVKPRFQNDTFMGERATASRNFCLAYMMEEEGVFPYNTDLQKTLEAYFSWCSIEVNCESMSMVAASLANGGICPTTNERIFTYQTVTSCLSLMMSCGMYDFSGKFAFQIGFPAKSGVSGVLCVVIPGVCGFATFSPRLDSLGNSVRGIDFCQRLAKSFPYHVFCQENEIERKQEEHTGTASFMWSAASGDEQRVRQLAACGINVDFQDYDQRSALHLAAGEGHNGMVSLLLALKADINARDCHGNSPMDDAIREHKNTAKRTLQLSARQKQPQDTAWAQSKADHLFRYFAPEVALDTNGMPSIPVRILIEVLDQCGLDANSDPRFKFLEDVPDPFTAEDLSRFGKQHALLAYALRGQLVVPNFTRLCDKFEELFSTMIAEVREDPLQNACELESLNVMTVDGQRLHLGGIDQYLCAGDLISLPILALGIELVGQEVIMDFVGTEPSGAKSDTAILNADDVPYNPFMWNGMLSLISLLEEKCGNTERVIEEIWTQLCSLDQDSIMQCDEVWMRDDQQKHTNKVMVLLYSCLDLQKFPTQSSPEKVMDIFFRLRAIRTSTQGLGSIGAVFANSGRHPLTGDQIFQPETVKSVLSMMYAAGCNAQSGEFSFKVGIPAKSSSEGAVLLVLPNVLGMCIVSPEINHNNVSIGAMNFCTTFAQEFNCHVLAGDSKSSGKGDVTLYHFHTDMELCDQLLLAAEAGDTITLSALHQLGFSLDYSDYDYRSAAHVAACNNKMNVLKYLAKKGANMFPKDRWGSTPYDDATRKKHHKAACFLKSVEDQDDDMAMSDCGSCVSSMSSINHVRVGFGQSTKSERAMAPVAAKMGAMVTVEENNEDDDDDCW
jgi:glutaminase